MKRTLIIAALAIAALAPSPAIAAPAEQCARGATTQFDMAGTYRSSTMYVEIFPCGGIYVEWVNTYGRHSASYGTALHASDGVAASLTSDYGLDNQNSLAVKAAEPGYVQVWTLDGSLNVVNSYRLRKAS
jgi:hypothetical protein